MKSFSKAWNILSNRVLVYVSRLKRASSFTSLKSDVDCQDIDCRKVTATGEVKCTSTTAPFYPPVVTNTQRGAMSGMTKGAMVFNSSTNKLNVYNGSGWEVVTSSWQGVL